MIQWFLTDSGAIEALQELVKDDVLAPRGSLVDGIQARYTLLKKV